MVLSLGLSFERLDRGRDGGRGDGGGDGLASDKGITVGSKSSTEDDDNGMIHINTPSLHRRTIKILRETFVGFSFSLLLLLLVGKRQCETLDLFHFVIDVDFMLRISIQNKYYPKDGPWFISCQY